jgi:hypothetical protein
MEPSLILPRVTLRLLSKLLKKIRWMLNLLLLLEQLLLLRRSSASPIRLRLSWWLRRKSALRLGA